MKTLKKSLALVLAVVMVVGVLAVSASAATFTDSDKIENTEAVEVLSAIKVIDGLTDGSFAPDATLTRDQGAAFVVRMMLTRDVANTLGGSGTVFTDVKSNMWSVGVVEYAAQQGIINGIGDGRFVPGGELTVVQYAKMLLGAIGIEGEYSGANWYNNVVVAATKAKLTSGLTGVNFNAAVTREEAAQMTFNALTYSETGSVTDRIYGVIGYEKVEIDGTSAVVPTYGWIDVTSSGTDSVAYGTYKLTKGESAADSVDAFGRPATTWYQDGKKIATFANATPVLTYTTGVTNGKIYKDLGLNAQVASVARVKDGVSQTAVALAANGKVAIGGNGTLTEVYKVGNGYKIIEIVSHFSTVQSVRTVTAPETGVVTTTLTVVGGAATSDTELFKGIERKDPVVYTVATVDGEKIIQSINVANTVSGTLTKAVNEKEYTIGGTVYQVSQGSALTNAAIVGGSNANMGKTVNYYVDNYGYLIASVDTTAANTVGTYIKVLASDATSSGSYLQGTGKVGKVYGILSNGSYGEYTVNYAQSTVGGLTEADGRLKTGIYEYTVNTNGQLVIEGAATTVDTGAATVPGTSTPVVAGKVVNSNTMFIFATQNGENDLTIKTIDVKQGAANAGVIPAGATVVYEGNLAVVVFVGGTYSEAAVAADLVYVKSDATVNTTTTVEAGANGGYVSVTVYSVTGYTADGQEITVTSRNEIATGKVYSYNDDNTIASEVTPVTGTLTVYGTTIQIGAGYYTYDAENVAFVCENDAALADGQTVVAVTNAAGTTVTHMWVVTDAPEE